MKNLGLISKKWDYYRGDRHKENWIGVKPDLSTETGWRNEQAISRLLQSVDILKSAVDFHVSGLIGSSPVINPPELKEIYDGWRGTTSQDAAMDAVTECLTRAKATGYGYLRIFKDQGGRVLIHSPTPESIFVERDDNESIQWIDYTFSSDDLLLTERQTISNKGLTVFQILNKKDEALNTFEMDLGGKFSIQELRLTSLITESTMASQNAINHALTMIPRGNELSGFLARFFTNARPPGQWITLPDGTPEFKADPDGLVIGAGIVNFLSGLPLTDNLGNVTGYTPVGVHSDPPLPIQSFVDSYNLFSAIIYLGCSQGHRLGYALAMSGRSREELRGDFMIALRRDKNQIERMLRRSLLVYAAMSEMPVDKEVASIALNLDTGVLTQSEKDFILSLFREGLVDKETAIALLGL